MDIRNFFSKGSSNGGSALSNVRQTPENSKIKSAPPTKAKSPEKKKDDRKRKSDVKSILSDSDPEDPIPSKLSKKIGNPLPKQQKSSQNRKSKAIIESESDNEKSPKKFTNIRISPRNKGSKKPVMKEDMEISEYSSNENESSEVEKSKKSRRPKAGVSKSPKEESKKQKRKPANLADDDEDEFELPSTKKAKKIPSPFTKKTQLKINSPAKQKNVPKLNPISVSDFFGGSKVKNKNAEKIVEIELHSDDDFNETLKGAENDLMTPMSSHVSISKTPTKIQSPSKITPKKTNPVQKSIEILSKRVDKSPKTVDKSSKPADKASKPIDESPKRQTPSQAKNSLRTPSKNSEKSIDKRSKQKSPVIVRSEPPVVTICDDFLPWVEKYRPKSIKQIVGQQGERSCMNKLLNWLKNWKSWHVTKTKEKKKGYGPNDDGSIFKAALLSGSPGIGKTTTAQLCCKESGLNFVELNASDARSKKMLEKDVAESLACHSMDEFVKDSNAKHSKDDIRHVLIMDEVDGMSGNEDRAGMAELISLIKSSRVPIICICNDRQAQKIRSLANYCYDLRFHKPQVAQIRGPMMSVAYKEGLTIKKDSMDEIIEGANHDIRQVLHHLSLLAAGDRKEISTQEAQVASKNAKKDTSSNIFETIRVLFSDNEETRSMSLIDKSDLFFTDYSLMPLFVHENYLKAEKKDKGKMYEKLELISKAAESIAMGDCIEKQIRTGGNWTLLNDQAMYGAVIPAELVKGYLQGMTQFPQWFGKNSKQGRLQRLLQQLQIHTSLKISANFTSLNLDYVPALRSALTEPLTKGAADDVLRKLDAYDLTKEDMDNILELGQWPNAPDPMESVPSKVKAALTRAYNKDRTKLPYATAAAGTSKKTKGSKGPVAAELEMDEEGNLKEKLITADDDDDAAASGDEPDDSSILPKVSEKTKLSPVVKKGSKNVGSGVVSGRGGRGRGKKKI